MHNEPPTNDPQTVWQNQKTEETKVSLTQFKQKVERLRTRAIWTAVANDAALIALIVFLGYAATKMPDATGRAGAALMAVGGVFVLYRRHKQLWPQASEPGSAPASGIEAYRRELLRVQAASRDNWRLLMPMAPGYIVFALPRLALIARKTPANPATLVNAWPFFFVLSIWIVLVFPVRRERRKIQRELDDLDGMPGSGPGAGDQR